MGFFRWQPAYAGASCGCGPGSSPGPESGSYAFEGFGFGGFGAFGVRRPLRLLAYKLELDDAQVSELAKILDELKTERAQVAVDERRTLTSFADAVGGEKFDAKKAESGASLRMDGAERLKKAVLSALSRIHALLKPEQRERLSYLIRTGVLTL